MNVIGPHLPTGFTIGSPVSARQGVTGPAAGATSESSEPARGSLWDKLTEAEQAFFLQQEALGSLSYGPSRNGASPSAPTGQRIDVRG
jgi:hypothetical protein